MSGVHLIHQKRLQRGEITRMSMRGVTEHGGGGQSILSDCETSTSLLPPSPTRRRVKTSGTAMRLRVALWRWLALASDAKI